MHSYEEVDVPTLPAVTKPQEAIEGLPRLTRISYRPPEVAQVLGISRAKAYELISSGALKARKLGTATLVTADDLRAFIESLPTFEIN